MTKLSLEEYQNLPERNSVSNPVVDQLYRDAGSPDFVFMYLGEHRSSHVDWAAFHWQINWKYASNSG